MTELKAHEAIVMTIGHYRDGMSAEAVKVVATETGNLN